MNALDYSMRSNNEQSAHTPPTVCSYPDCTAPATATVHWRSTRDDPVRHTAASCARHVTYLELQAHVVAVEVQR